MEQLFDVVICDDATNTIVSVIGKGLNARQVERRIETGVAMTNMDKYHVKEVPAAAVA